MATLTIADLDNGKRDLQTVDEVANSRAAAATTRFGQQTTTLYESIRRINATGDEILSNLGFRVPVPYASGLNVTDSRFTVTGPDGKVYAPLSAPFTTGAWDPSQWYVLQNDLNDRKLLVFETLLEAEAAAAVLPDGQQLTATTVDGLSARYSVTGGVPWFEKLERAPEVTIEDFGASSEATPTKNAEAFIAAINSGKRIASPVRAYIFQFDGQPITYGGAVLDIDLGMHKHTFLNFGGIVANSLIALRYNGRFSANNGYCKGLGRFRNLQRVDIGTLEITDVFCDEPTRETQFFGLEYSSNTYTDNQFTMNIGTAIFKNIKTRTPDFPSATPMTGIGNFGSSTVQSQFHQVTVGNLYVADFHSVNPDDGSVVGGDSEFFRLFTNPTNLTIGNCQLSNVGKRFIKTQAETNVTVVNLDTKLDSRFTNLNYNGTFEGQNAVSGKVTRFIVLDAKVDYPVSVVPVTFFNASGLPHEMYLHSIEFKGLGLLMQSVAGVLHIRSAKGDCFLANITNSSNFILDDARITRFYAANAIGSVIRDSKIALADDAVSSGFPFGSKAKFSNVELTNWDTNVRVVQFLSLHDVSIDYTRGTSTRRPFWPTNGATTYFENVTKTGLEVAGLIESPGAGTAGTVICRGYRSTSALAFVSQGSWSFVLDNCNNDTVTGSGVVSVSRAIYGAKLSTATASLDFGSINAGTSVDRTVTATGASVTLGAVFASPQGTLAAGLSWSARVSGSNTVTVRVTNSTTGALTPAVVDWRVAVLQF